MHKIEVDSLNGIIEKHLNNKDIGSLQKMSEELSDTVHRVQDQINELVGRWKDTVQQQKNKAQAQRNFILVETALQRLAANIL